MQQDSKKTCSFEVLVNKIYTNFLIASREEGIVLSLSSESFLSTKIDAILLEKSDHIATKMSFKSNRDRSKQKPLNIKDLIQDAIASAALGNKITCEVVKKLEHFPSCLDHIRRDIGLKDLEPDTLAEIFAKSVNRVISQQRAPGGPGR